MKTLRLPLILSALVAFASPLAQADNYKFDTVHTQILFSTSHLGFSTSTGAFVDFDGGFNYEADNVSKSAVNVTIKTASIDMNNDTWNDHLSGGKWFDVANHPEITFKSTSVKSTGDKTMDITGDLTIKGVTKSVVLKAVFNKAGEAFGKEKIGFEASTKIDRTEFGMDTFAGAIGSEIDIRITVEGEKA